VVAINVDNASNNDTMVKHLETLLLQDLVEFNPSDVRMRCMPHTIHLAALELLKAIGVVKDNKKDAYQDSVTAPLNRAHDDNSGGDIEGLDKNIAAAEAPLSEVLTAIPKLRNIIQAVCSSPQQQEAWLEEANAFLQKVAAASNMVPERAATMLILNVKT
ncbi:hypothetical protein BJV78DRAFT_1090396, partial [Lactifluus subvellereus]